MRLQENDMRSVVRLPGIENTSVIDRTWERAYGAPFTTPEECIGAIEFPLDVYLGRVAGYDIEAAPAIDNLRSKPAMLVEGMKDRAIPPELAIADFMRNRPKGPVVDLPNAGHFCREDAPETLVALVPQFIQTTD